VVHVRIEEAGDPSDPTGANNRSGRTDSLGSLVIKAITSATVSGSLGSRSVEPRVMALPEPG
jgi:hypothetical protein